MPDAEQSSMVRALAGLALVTALAGCETEPGVTDPLDDTTSEQTAGSDVHTVMRPVSREDIADHIADRNRVRWTKAATLMLHGTQACMDGRDAHAIVGTPGGDAGELVLALATAEHLHGRAFTSAEVAQIFDAYLEAFGHFYMHTDDHAVAALVERLRVEHPDADLPKPDDHDALARFMQSPPPELRDEMLDMLTQPAFVGCGHLRLMLQHPEAYGVRPELVAAVLRNFHRDLWAGHPATDFVVLQGRHEESAVVTVELPHDVHTYTRIPLVSPRVGDTEIFVVHPQVARFVRRENAAFLLEQVPLLQESADEAAFFAELERLAHRQESATLQRLAPSLPRYSVVFESDAFEVLGPTDAGPGRSSSRAIARTHRSGPGLRTRARR
jgi:hypothetical protein